MFMYFPFWGILRQDWLAAIHYSHITNKQLQTQWDAFQIFTRIFNSEDTGLGTYCKTLCRSILQYSIKKLHLSGHSYIVKYHTYTYKNNEHGRQGWTLQKYPCESAHSETSYDIKCQMTFSVGIMELVYANLM